MLTKQYGEHKSDQSSQRELDFWQDETVSLLALSLLKGMGYWTLRKIALSGVKFQEVTQSVSEATLLNYLNQSGCKVSEKVARNWFQSKEKLWQEAHQLYRELKDQGIEVIHGKEERFPKTLQEIQEPPMWLFVQGSISVLHQPALTIVGTRNPTQDGKFLAQYVGRCLPYFKCVTVSGLASGIDQIIHKNSLRFDIKTIAFIGTGILLNYPSGSEELRQEIYDNGGAIVSEYLPRQSYSAANFVHRNRLQAGLARLVIPVEWKEKGGTAHTVRFAQENNRAIACLKQQDWGESHTELSLASKIGAKIFTIPGQESEFIKTVEQYLEQTTDKRIPEKSKNSESNNKPKSKSNLNQLELFN